MAAIAALALFAAVVAAHSNDGGWDYDDGDWHIAHMIEHHASMGQWVEDHEGADWHDHMDEPYHMMGWGCH
ncbi:MAG: hypothetical protein GF416_07610 [Candidatus Altiarchaeales archaeon]|nr:hypothetical protein [Candidatus Altiarchaeales archaeon]MBD3416978.1 hypothetical protein [Candidatus Altiarchaeales archaeon]